MNVKIYEQLTEDLNRVGFALAQNEPGLECLREAKAATARVRTWMESLPEVALGLMSGLASVERALAGLGKRNLFSGDFRPEGLAEAAEKSLEAARADHLRLRDYVEAHNLARMICALDQEAADRAAGLARR